MIELKFIFGLKENEEPLSESEICLTSALRSLKCYEGAISAEEFLRRTAETALQAALMGKAEYRVQLSGPEDYNEGMSEGAWVLTEAYITITAVHHVPDADALAMYY